MSYRADKLGDGRTDAGNDNTQRPILASGKNYMVCDLNDRGRMEIGHVFASGAVVGHATTHEWSRANPQLVKSYSNVFVGWFRAVGGVYAGDCGQHLTEQRAERPYPVSHDSIVYCFVMYNKIIFQFKNKDFLLLFYYLTLLVSRAAQHPKFDFCFSNFTEFKWPEISDICRNFIHVEMKIRHMPYGDHIRQSSQN